MYWLQILLNYFGTIPDIQLDNFASHTLDTCTYSYVQKILTPGTW